MESLLPFLQGTCTPYNMPVYPGAQCMIAESPLTSVSDSACSRQLRSLADYFHNQIPEDPYTSSPIDSRERTG